MFRFFLGSLAALLVTAASCPELAQAQGDTEIEKCETSGSLSANIRGRVRLYKNDAFTAWLSLNHKVTRGDSKGLVVRTEQIPFLGLELRVDNDGEIGRINGSLYMAETWSQSQSKYVTHWDQTFSFGDIELKNDPINMLIMSRNGEYQQHKTRLGIASPEGDTQKILSKLKAGAPFKSRAVNADVPTEYFEVEIDMSDVPAALSKMEDALDVLKDKAAQGGCQLL